MNTNKIVVLSVTLKMKKSIGMIVMSGLENNEYEGFSIYAESNNFNLLCNDEYQYELKINYCPMCGRDLREVRKLSRIKEDFND